MTDLRFALPVCFKSRKIRRVGDVLRSLFLIFPIGGAAARGCGPATAGCRGGVSPCKAQRRHRGARSAMASAMSVLCKICGVCGNTLAVLRQSRLSIYFVYAADLAFEGLEEENHQNENFSSHRFFARFGAGFGRIAHLHQFQITYCQSISYPKNRPSPSRLQRLPRQK